MVDTKENEQELVASVIAEVEQDRENNMVALKNGKINFDDLKGDWKLLFTTSRTMIINKSLSGLGRSSSEYSQFVSLVQKLGGNKWVKERPDARFARMKCRRQTNLPSASLHTL